MSRQVLGTVVLRHPDSGDIVSLMQGDECPDWAAALITNPAVLAPDGDANEKPKARTAAKGK